MASSVEIRSPFLDWQFFQYALAIPADIKIKDGQNKSILRNTFKDMLPDYIVNKKFKQGLPIVEYRKDEIAYDLVKNSIIQEDFKTSDLWDSQKIISDFNSKENRSKKIHKILNIVKIYLMHKGFKERKEKFKNLKNNCKVNYNKLN